MRRLTLGVVTAMIIVLTALSGSFGRAKPLGSYRPELPPPTFSSGCWSLPDGVDLDFSYQVRRDADVDGRRVLLMQFNLISAEEVAQRLAAAFDAAGFTVQTRQDGQLMAKTGYGTVYARVSALHGIDADSIVRGSITLDLPVSEPASHDGLCANPFVTKRFEAGAA